MPLSRPRTRTGFAAPARGYVMSCGGLFVVTIVVLVMVVVMVNGHL